MALLTIVTMLAVAQYFYFGAKVGGAREKYDVKAPATTGNETFERYYRIHYNTLEQLVSFIPALWAFGHFVSQPYAAGLGAVFILGRFIYSASYLKDPKSRSIGAVISSIPIIILIIGAFICHSALKSALNNSL
ncbi:MAG: glutathione S-transferase [Alteromonadaceae bacterium]|jgi:glutathione S-transferase